MDIIGTIAWSILASIIASFIFWILTFRISRTNVEFSPVIEKSKNTGEYPGKYRYRVKFINSGKRDLIEVSFLTKISLKRKKVSNYTYLGLGNDNSLPILRGKRYQKKNSGLSHAAKLTLYPTETTLNEFKKSFYTDGIREKAENGILSLDDILDEYSDTVKITIFVYGNDSLTGARKMFSSYTYGIDNIKMGKYNVANSLNSKHIRYKQYVIDTLSFIESQKAE